MPAISSGFKGDAFNGKPFSDIRPTSHPKRLLLELIYDIRFELTDPEIFLKTKWYNAVFGLSLKQKFVCAAVTIIFFTN